MATGTEEMAAEMTIAWVRALAQAATSTSGNLDVVRKAVDQLTGDSVAGFYDRMHKQIVDTRTGK